MSILDKSGDKFFNPNLNKQIYAPSPNKYMNMQNAII